MRMMQWTGIRRGSGISEILRFHPEHWTKIRDDIGNNRNVVIERNYIPDKLVEVGDWVIVNDDGTFFDDLNYLKSI